MTTGSSGLRGDRERERASVNRLLGASMAVLVVVLVVGVLATTTNPGSRVWLSPIGVICLFAVPFASRARTDPIWYASIVVPALLATLMAPALPRPISYVVSAAGLLFVMPWLVGPRVLTDWWWSTVLRRPRWSVGRRFDWELRQELRQWADALGGPGALEPDRERAARAAVERMRALTAPEPAWAGMRDAYVRECLRWIETPRDEVHADDWAAIRRDFQALHPRRLELVERTR